MALPTHRSFLDPIHGTISLTSWELEIVNCSIVRRLQGIKQLGIDYLVFPGANHTRFEHSLGVMQTAHFIGGKLQLSDERLVVLRLAALLHDLGHGPFSHFFEELVGRCGCSKNHEHFGARMLECDEMKEAFQRAEMCVAKNTSPGMFTDVGLGNQVARLLRLPRRECYDKTLESQILASELDADRIDYLARDSHHLGTKYGEIDIVRLVFDGLRNKGDRIVLTETGVKIAEVLLLARSHVLTDVSLNPECRLLNAKLWRVAEASKDLVTTLRLFKDTGNPAEVPNTYDDYSFLVGLLKSHDLSAADRVFLEYLLSGSVQWVQRYQVESLAWFELHPLIQPSVLQADARARARWERRIEREIQDRVIGRFKGQGTRVNRENFEIIVDIPELRELDISEAMVYSERTVLSYPEGQHLPQMTPEHKYERLDQYSEVVSCLSTVLRNEWRLRIYYAADREDLLSEIRTAILEYCHANLLNRGHGLAARHFKKAKSKG